MAVSAFNTTIRTSAENSMEKLETLFSIYGFHR
jgi:hypothetical protein